mmetsp:Transcript_38142/g.85158  ORF Transcript_38142/g.85158 Transcript_38142/m.85158 type:complete len:631 (-) Transcript_38142:178-2070(-)
MCCVLFLLTSSPFYSHFCVFFLLSTLLQPNVCALLFGQPFWPRPGREVEPPTSLDRAGPLKKTNDPFDGILARHMGNFDHFEKYKTCLLQTKHERRSSSCESTFMKPVQSAKRASHHFEKDSWPNPTMRCASRYWNYRSAALLSGLDDDLHDDSEDAAFTRLRTENSRIGKCCSLADGELSEIERKVARPVRIAYPNRGRRGRFHEFRRANLEVRHLCASATGASVNQNPIMFGIHTTRWFNACPGNIKVQYLGRATRAGRTYPFSVQNPFLYQFDWMIGPFEAHCRKWLDLGTLAKSPIGSAKNPRDRDIQAVGLYVQRSSPKIIYVVKGLPYLQLFEEVVLQVLKDQNRKVTLYVGGGGIDGSPDARQLIRLVNHTSINAVYAENLELSTDDRPPRLFNAPIGICMREAVSFAASFVETVGRAPAFDDRHSALYGCYGGGYPYRIASSEQMRDPQNKHLVWCADQAKDDSYGAKGDAKSMEASIWDGGSHCNDTSLEDVRAREFWHNASRFKFAFSPWGNGLECYRTFELLALGCIVVMADYPGARTAYEGLPVAFIPTKHTIRSGVSDGVQGASPGWLAEVEAKLGPLAQDARATRRKLSASHWAKKIREHVPDQPKGEPGKGALRR